MRGHHATQCNGHARRAAGQRIPIRPAQTACIQDGSEDEVAVGAWPRRRISLEARVTYKGLPWAAAQVARLCQTGYLLP